MREPLPEPLPAGDVYHLMSLRSISSAKCPPHRGLFHIDNAIDEWEAARDAVLERWTRERPGTRPGAWWALDAPKSRAVGEHQVDFLERHNLLTAEEQKALDRG